MMMFLLLLLILLLAVPSQGRAQEWIETDLRGLEVAPGPDGRPNSCARLWIEERTWSLSVMAGGPAGSYMNRMYTVPLTLGLSCRFLSNPATPMALNFRTWKIVHAFPDGSLWKVRAEPIGVTGVPLDLPFEPFSTHLWVHGERLIDSATNGDDSERLEFRRPGLPPEELRQAAQSTLESLNSGACARVLADIANPLEPPELSSAKLAGMCDLYRRMASLGGGFVSVTLGNITTLDRVPVALLQHNPFAQGLQSRTVYLVDYTTNFAQQAVPASALFTKEGERWRLVRFLP
jgi:hypothetical protein